MKFQLNLQSDSYNSNTDNTHLEIDDYGDRIWLTLQDPEREVSVSKEDLIKVLKVLT